MSGSDLLRIERLGGLGGFGLPGARVRSCGELEYGSLDAATQQAVDRLFLSRGGARSRSTSSAVRDGFRYHLSRAQGARVEIVEVTEAELPQVILGSLKEQFV